ncbi:MAG: hypothetical protein GX568_07685 [Candidatus Gastranaerophilales bacterium]|nr:hypothetical protein [Candidatus Gastranaerophilales bacterium]
MLEHAITEPSTIFGISKALFAGIVLFVAYTFIVLEKVPKVTTALVGAAIILVFGIVSTETAFSHVDLAYWLCWSA